MSSLTSFAVSSGIATMLLHKGSISVFLSLCLLRFLLNVYDGEVDL